MEDITKLSYSVQCNMQAITATIHSSLGSVRNNVAFDITKLIWLFMRIPDLKP